MHLAVIEQVIQPKAKLPHNHPQKTGELFQKL
jgi:hypothetical protein